MKKRKNRCSNNKNTFRIETVAIVLCQVDRTGRFLVNRPVEPRSFRVANGRPSCFNDRTQAETMNPECTICSDDMEPSTVLASAPCGHAFHNTCLHQWLARSHTCPQCRHHLRPHHVRTLFLNFVSNNAEKMRNIEKRIGELQHILQLKETEIRMSRSEREKLIETLKLQNDNFHKYLAQISQLETKQSALRSELELKNNEVKHLSEQLKEKEMEIDYLKECVKTNNEAHRVQIEIQAGRHDKLTKELTARCVEIEESNRELTARCVEIEESNRKLTARCAEVEEKKSNLLAELEKLESEVIAQQAARAMKEEPVPCIELVSEEEENEVDTSRKAKTVKRKPAPSIELDSVKQENEVDTSRKTDPVQSTELESEKQENKVATLRKVKAEEKESVTSTELETGRGEKTVRKLRATKKKPVPSTELESEKGDNKVATSRKTRAAKKESVSSVEIAASQKRKRAQRKPLSTIDSNTNTQEAPKKSGYFLRPR